MRLVALSPLAIGDLAQVGFVFRDHGSILDMALLSRIGGPAADFGFLSCSRSCTRHRRKFRCRRTLSSMRVAGRRAVLTRRERVAHTRTRYVAEFSLHHLSTSVVHRS